MPTVYEQAARRVVDGLMKREDTGWRQLLFNTAWHLNGSEYPPSYQDVIMQPFRRKADVYDAYSFLQVHAAIQLGHVALFRIPLGHCPMRDKAVEANNRLLGDLDWPFSGEFWGGCGDFDGHIHWEIPIHAVRYSTELEALAYVIVRSFPQGKDGALLEVGHICPHKMYTYIQTSMRAFALVRWPYYQDSLTVLVPTREGVVYCENDDGFDQIADEVLGGRGNFDALANPYDEWNDWKGGM